MAARARAGLIAAVRRELAARADPARAEPMRTYMKSELPFYGVQGPGQGEAFRAAFAGRELAGFEEWQATVLALWRGARFREERYAAIALTGDRRYRGLQTPRTLPLYEELIVTGAWWDLVDPVAIHRIGPILRADPERVAPVMREWSRSDSLWKRRASIICQNASKRDTDPELLAGCVEPNVADREFFIRKAIGWALREYAKTEPEWVRRFVERHDLAPLSRREALKRL